MTLDAKDKAKIEALISVFETGTLKPDYANVTNAKGDTGGLTFGKHQTTINSGNLYKLLLDYVSEPAAAYRTDFVPYLDRVENKDATLAKDKKFIALLKQSATDPVMQRTQDAFFDRIYWNPAQAWATKHGFIQPLSMAVIYDSFIHSGSILPFLRTRFPAKPPTDGGNERQWITQYVNARHHWLATHSNKLLQKTIYRTHTFLSLIANEDWFLEEPIQTQGLTIV